MRCGCVGRAPQGPGLPGRVSMPSSPSSGENPFPRRWGATGRRKGEGGACAAGRASSGRDSSPARVGAPAPGGGGEGGAGARAALSGSHSPPPREPGAPLPVGLGSCPKDESLSWSGGARRFDSPGAGERSGGAERRTRWARGWERRLSLQPPPSGPTSPALWEPPEFMAWLQTKSPPASIHKLKRPQVRPPAPASRGGAGRGGRRGCRPARAPPTHPVPAVPPPPPAPPEGPARPAFAGGARAAPGRAAATTRPSPRGAPRRRRY